jgi:hypothetical protein
MMNPHMAEDITVLQQYLTPTTSTPTKRSTPLKPYSTISTSSGDIPVVYMTVPKRRQGLRAAVDPGRAQREVIEQVLNPLASEVRKVYFDHLHPCFPILDERTFQDMWDTNNDRISSTLVCDLYASALSVWNRSAVLCHHIRPDPHFIWNQAVSALQDDFMAPTISTVHAAVLDLLGRPVIGVTGNIVNAGRIVTLAQSLGLHRNPSSWKATDHEKGVRINLWWGILIHDYWSSIGHGTPPTINPLYFDVPIPAIESTIVPDSESQARSTFVHLCTLSQILGDILPLVYSIQQDPNEIKRQLRKAECKLDDWILELPEYLRPNFTTAVVVNGSSNLWFAYLSVKVLVCRLSFRAGSTEAQKSPETRQYQLAMLRHAASDVADFIITLTEAQLLEFWMPYTSYLLVTAATILLRCTIESSDLNTKKTCMIKLVAFRDRLRTAQTESQWDLAEFCLERCDEPIQKIADAIGIFPQRISMTALVDEPPAAASGESDLLSIDPSEMTDFFLPVDPLDYPWETLWDGMERPWSIQM